MVQHKVDYLAPAQEAILAVIRHRIREDGEAPTIAELRAATGRSTGSLTYQLGELEAKHAIIREPGRKRGIRLT